MQGSRVVPEYVEAQSLNLITREVERWSSNLQQQTLNSKIEVEGIRDLMT